MWSTNCADGSVLNRNRKLMPTNPERMVWGLGDATGLRSIDTPCGRIGSLICWESFMPLVRYALYAHLAARTHRSLDACGHRSSLTELGGMLPNVDALAFTRSPMWLVRGESKRALRNGRQRKIGTLIKGILYVARCVWVPQSCGELTGQAVRSTFPWRENACSCFLDLDEVEIDYPR